MAGSRKLGRPTDHRNAMLRGMVTYLLENGSIETTPLPLNRICFIRLHCEDQDRMSEAC